MKSAAEGQDRGVHAERKYSGLEGPGPSEQVSGCAARPRYWNDLEECWKRYWSQPRQVGLSEYALDLSDNCWKGYEALLRGRASAHGYTPSEAEDLTQAFFLALFQHRYLDSYDPDRASFRGFLLMLFQRFASNYSRKHHALKRGAGAVPSSYPGGVSDLDQCEGMMDWRTPDRICQHNCVTELILQAERNLCLSHRGERDAESFSELIPFVRERRRNSRQSSSGSRLSRPALKMRLCRLRQRYVSLLLQQLKANGVPAEELRDHLDYLAALLCLPSVTWGLSVGAFLPA